VPVLIKSTAALLLTVLFTACSNPTFQDEPSPEFKEEGLYPVRATGFAEVNARRDAQLSSYAAVTIEALELDNVQISEAVISGATPRDWQMTAAREQVLVEAWKTAMEWAFRDYDRSGNGNNSLRITAQLTHVRPRSRSAIVTTHSGVPTPGSGDVVDISIEIRLYDQASGKLLAVIRDRRDVLAVQWIRSNGRDISILFTSWSGLLEGRVSGS